MNAFWDYGDWNVYVQRQFWRRDFLVEAGIVFPEGPEHEDELFSHKGILSANRVKYLDKRYFIRRFRDNSVMTREPLPRDFAGYLHCFCEMTRFADEREKAGIEISRAETENILQVYNLASLYHPAFEKAEDAESWFTSAKELEMYNTLKYLIRYDVINKDKNDAVWLQLDAFDHIYVYGAGKMGYTAIRRMLAAEKTIDAVLVSSMEGNPVRLRGIGVKPLGEIEFLDNSAVVIATGARFHNEIIKMLSGRGVPYFLYAHAELKGPFVPGA